MKTHTLERNGKLNRRDAINAEKTHMRESLRSSRLCGLIVRSFAENAAPPSMILVRVMVICLGFFIAISSVTQAAEKKPNFLFVYTDDQRWDAMGVVQREQGERARFPWFQTPNMDRVAAEGVRFRNAFVTLSLCAPSRAAFLTGRYNHLNGVFDNHTQFPETSVTHATLLGA